MRTLRQTAQPFSANRCSPPCADHHKTEGLAVRHSYVNRRPVEKESEEWSRKKKRRHEEGMKTRQNRTHNTDAWEQQGSRWIDMTLSGFHRDTASQQQLPKSWKCFLLPLFIVLPFSLSLSLSIDWSGSVEQGGHMGHFHWVCESDCQSLLLENFDLIVNSPSSLISVLPVKPSYWGQDGWCGVRADEPLTVSKILNGLLSLWKEWIGCDWNGSSSLPAYFPMVFWHATHAERTHTQSQSRVLVCVCCFIVNRPEKAQVQRSKLKR